MEIVVNTRLLLKDQLDGIGWFSHQVLRRLSINHPDVHFTFLFDRPFHPDFIYGDNVTPVIVSPQARHPVLYYLWLQHGVRPFLRRMKPDLFFSPDGFLPLGAGCKMLPVIHDINFVHYPGHSKWLTSKYYRHYFPKFAQAADRVLTVSEFSKTELVKHFHVPPEKIDVTCNGVNEFFEPLGEAANAETRQEASGGLAYFLFVGSVHPRKNLTNALRAYELYRRDHHEVQRFVIAGRPFWGNRELVDLVKNSSVASEIVFTGRVDDETLARLMAAAHALVFVPLYEGFGIPLIEAMACDVPVITSNRSSLPEVAGNAALLVNPEYPAEIAGAMNTVDQPSIRSRLIEAGRQRCLVYTWDKSARLVWESILKTAGHR